MLSEQLALLPDYLTAHLQLTLLALLVSTAVSVPLGIAATRIRWLEQPALAVAGVIQTVPSLALLAVMVPVLAALDLQSIGFLPAAIGLTLYGLLPVLRNTVTGIAGIDPALKEAAQGVGMTPRQQLARVELPLAMPVIIAGVRTATVWVVGIATLSTPVGATSLGNYIFSGLQTRNTTAVLVGCVAAAGLALLLDGLVRTIEASLTARRRSTLAAAIGAVILLYAYAGATFAAPFVGGARPADRHRGEDLHRAIHPERRDRPLDRTRDRPADTPRAVARIDCRVRRARGRRGGSLRRLQRNDLGAPDGTGARRRHRQPPTGSGRR